MNITFNQSPLCVEESITIKDLLRQKNIDKQTGIAIALNNSVVPKEKWEHTILQENDMLLLIGASYGG